MQISCPSNLARRRRALGSPCSAAEVSTASLDSSRPAPVAIRYALIAAILSGQYRRTRSSRLSRENTPELAFAGAPANAIDSRLVARTDSTSVFTSLARW